MDILGIGFPELIFILIIAMMVFGPRRLPEIAGKLGKIVRDVRGMSQGLLLEWQREITVAARLEEIQEVRKELQLTQQELKKTQHEIGQQTRQDLEQVKKAGEALSITDNKPKPVAASAPTQQPETDSKSEPPSTPVQSETVTPAADGDAVDRQDTQESSLEPETVTPAPSPEFADSNGRSAPGDQDAAENDVENVASSNLPANNV